MRKTGDAVGILRQCIAIIHLTVTAGRYLDCCIIPGDRQRAFGSGDLVVVRFEAGSFGISNRVCRAPDLRDRAGCLKIGNFTTHESITSHCDIRCCQGSAIVFSGYGFRSQRDTPPGNRQGAVVLRNRLELIGYIISGCIFNCNCLYNIIRGSYICDTAAYSNIRRIAFRKSGDICFVLCQRSAIILPYRIPGIYYNLVFILRNCQSAFICFNRIVFILVTGQFLVGNRIGYAAGRQNAARCLNIAYFTVNKPIAANSYIRSCQSRAIIYLAC